MKLRDFLKQKGRGSLGELARKIEVNLPDLSAWANEKRPVPIHHCLTIELATNGEVTRKDLRPDWRGIWIELAEKETTTYSGSSKSD